MMVELKQRALAHCPGCHGHVWDEARFCDEHDPDGAALCMGSGLEKPSKPLDECPRNCTTFQQYGDCDHRRPSEVVELKRERDALQQRVAVLEKALNDMVPGPYEPWLMLERSARDAALRGGRTK